MTGYYTLTQGAMNGSRISVYLWDDFLDGETSRRYADVGLIDVNGFVRREIKKPVFKDKMGIFIEFNGEKVYLKDYEYMPIDMLIKYMASCKLENRYVSEDIIWATFMRDTENIGVLCDCPMFEAIIPEMGIGMTGDNYKQILCVPTESRRKKSSWGYKITLEPDIQGLKRFFATRDFYFSDFCSMLKSGDCILVNKDDYKTAQALKQIMGECEKKKSVSVFSIFR